MSFEKLFDNWDLLDFVKENNFSKPTEIQEKAIPLLRKKKSLVAAAQTGTGKTLAFALPSVELVKRIEEEEGISDEKGTPVVIVLAPTRELARQLERVYKSITHHAKCRVRLLASGESGKKTVSTIKGGVEILVTVPGKLLSSIKKKEINPREVRMLILDEADQLLDMGFSKEIKEIHQCLAYDVQVALFSATISEKFKEFQDATFEGVEFLNITLKGTHKVLQNIETYNIFMTFKEKEKLAIEFLKTQGKGQGIIFLNQKGDAEKLHELLTKEYPRRKFHLLHGGMTPIERKKSYNKFVEHKGILIATDIAARGIDIDGLAWVLNYDLPFDAVYYIHRVGRTGRQGKKGNAYNFVTPKDTPLVGKINEAITTQDTLKIKPLEMLKKKKTVSKHQNLTKGGLKKKAKKVVSRKEITQKNKAKKARRSPGFARRKKAKK